MKYQAVRAEDEYQLTSTINRHIAEGWHLDSWQAVRKNDYYFVYVAMFTRGEE